MSETKTKKDDLYSEALEEFGTKLDRRLTLQQLEDQLSRLKTAKNSPINQQPKLRPKIVLNMVTGHKFPYHSAFKGNADLQVVEWEEDDGNE